MLFWQGSINMKISCTGPSKCVAATPGQQFSGWKGPFTLRLGSPAGSAVGLRLIWENHGLIASQTIRLTVLTWGFAHIQVEVHFWNSSKEMAPLSSRSIASKAFCKDPQKGIWAAMAIVDSNAMMFVKLLGTSKTTQDTGWYRNIQQCSLNKTQEVIVLGLAKQDSMVQLNLDDPPRFTRPHLFLVWSPIYINNPTLIRSATTLINCRPLTSVWARSSLAWD